MRLLLKILAAVVVVAVVLLIIGGVAFWRFPLGTLELMSRRALASSGLERIEIAGSRGPLVYWRGGDGATVVFLHGSNDQAGGWASVVQPLRDSYRLVVVDLPGHGDSEPSEGPLSVGDLLAGVEAVVEEEAQGDKVTLVGNSMGGWLSLLCAHKMADKVSHVVLVNGAALKGETEVNLLPRNREEARKAVDAVMGPGAPITPDFILDDLVRRAPTSPLARLMESSFEEYLLDGKLHEIRVPVSLLWGNADEIMPPAYAQRVQNELPATHLHFIDGCGHIPQRECPEEFLPLLEHALAQPPAPATTVEKNLE